MPPLPTTAAQLTVYVFFQEDDLVAHGDRQPLLPPAPTAAAAAALV